MNEDAWRPFIEDDGGYRVTRGDLRYLALFDDDVQAFQARIRPLGLDDRDYADFVATFWSSVVEQGLCVEDVDARIKGSSIAFFSGPHKAMPYRKTEVTVEFRKGHGRLPESWEERAIMDRLDDKWPSPTERPLRRPFNVLHRLHIHYHPSDVDLQISSDAIWQLGLDAIDAHEWHGAVRVDHPTYNFMDKELFAFACRQVERWRLEMAHHLRRKVTIAAFPTSGPPDVSGDPDPSTAALSSHLDDDRDWILPKPNATNQ